MANIPLRAGRGTFKSPSSSILGYRLQRWEVITEKQHAESCSLCGVQLGLEDETVWKFGQTLRFWRISIMRCFLICFYISHSKNRKHWQPLYDPSLNSFSNKTKQNKRPQWNIFNSSGFQTMESFPFLSEGYKELDLKEALCAMKICILKVRLYHQLNCNNTHQFNFSWAPQKNSMLSVLILYL